MAASKGFYARSNFRFLDAHAPVMTPDSMFELDESDVWSTAARSSSPEFRKPAPSSRRKFSPKCENNGGGTAVGGKPSSVPMDVPDWSKILKDEYRDNRRRYGGGEFDFDDDDDDKEEVDGGAGANRIPPHEFLARTRMASFSVHEGVGRTLKGRDLSRVRNSIWQKTGFED